MGTSQLSPSPKVNLAIKYFMAKPHLGHARVLGVLRDSVFKKSLTDRLIDVSGTIYSRS
jgi:hypothetical protein